MKTNFYLLVAILVFFGNSLFAKEIIAVNTVLGGRVIDVITKEPLSGVSVFLADLKIGTSTNNDGYFEIKNIPDGKHLVEISHIGYISIAKYVDLIADNKIDFELVQSVVENKTVIISGAGSASQLKKTPFQVSVLRKEDLQQSVASNIIEVLSKQPGVSSVSTGPAISKPVIRGLGFNRVLTINDGVRQEGQQWGDEHGIEIDEASVNKVEILKGPASLIYGSDALAGVINIITNVPIENNTIKSNIQSGYQTNNQSFLLHANIAGNKSKLNWNAYTSVSRAYDYKNKYDGYVLNSKFSQKNFGGYLGYNNTWGYTHLIFSHFNLKAGSIEGERDADGFFVKTIFGGAIQRADNADFNTSTPLIPYQHIQHLKLALDNSIKVAKNRIAINIAYQQNNREEFGNVDDISERALYMDLKTFTSSFRFHANDIKGWKSIFGITTMYQKNINKGVEQLIPDYKQFDVGGFAFAQKTIKAVTFSGGIRYDVRQLNTKSLLDGNNIKQQPFEKKFSNFSTSIGTTIQANDKINFKLNIAKGFRAPSINELGSNGAHEGTIRHEYGNTNLKNETSWQLDASVEFTTEHFALNVSTFLNSINNFIFYRKLQSAAGADSLINDNGRILTAFTFNQQPATLKGIEATMDIHPHPLDWLHFENTFSMVIGSFKNPIENTVAMPFMPATKLLSEVRGDFKKLSKHLTNFYFKVEFDNTFSQQKIFNAYNTETLTPAYTLLNAAMGVQFINSAKHTICTLHLMANNISDVAYQNHLSRLKSTAINNTTGRVGVFNMGRNFGIKLIVPLTFSLSAKN